MVARSPRDNKRSERETNHFGIVIDRNDTTHNLLANGVFGSPIGSILGDEKNRNNTCLCFQVIVRDLSIQRGTHNTLKTVLQHTTDLHGEKVARLQMENRQGIRLYYISKGVLDILFMRVVVMVFTQVIVRSVEDLTVTITN